MVANQSILHGMAVQHCSTTSGDDNSACIHHVMCHIGQKAMPELVGVLATIRLGSSHGVHLHVGVHRVGVHHLPLHVGVRHLRVHHLRMQHLGHHALHGHHHALHALAIWHALHGHHHVLLVRLAALAHDCKASGDAGTRLQA